MMKQGPDCIQPMQQIQNFDLYIGITSQHLGIAVRGSLYRKRGENNDADYWFTVWEREDLKDHSVWWFSTHKDEPKYLQQIIEKARQDDKLIQFEYDHQQWFIYWIDEDHVTLFSKNIVFQGRLIDYKMFRNNDILDCVLHSRNDVLVVDAINDLKCYHDAVIAINNEQTQVKVQLVQVQPTTTKHIYAMYEIENQPLNKMYRKTNKIWSDQEEAFVEK